MLRDVTLNNPIAARVAAANSVPSHSVCVHCMCLIHYMYITCTLLLCCFQYGWSYSSQSGSHTISGLSYFTCTLMFDTCTVHMFGIYSCVVFSMGGAVAARVAAANSVPSLIGLAVIDVVEGKVRLPNQHLFMYVFLLGFYIGY